MTNEENTRQMQFLEQNLQGLMFQKQSFQAELSETKAALKELESSGEEVFKIIGQIMLKADKSKMQKELLEKEKILEMRIQTLEKQEASIAEQLDQLGSDSAKLNKE